MKPFPIYGRVRIPKATRLRIFKRDGHKCKKCGAAHPLTVDHVIPVAEGGSNRDNNLQTLCRPCNQAKAAEIQADYIRT